MNQLRVNIMIITPTKVTTALIAVDNVWLSVVPIISTSLVT